MQTMTRGQRFKLADLTANPSQFSIGVKIDAPLMIDFSCFGLDAQGKLSDDRYMTFYNQPATPCGGVKLYTPPGDRAGFAFNLQRLPDNISRLAVTASIEGEGTMSMMKEGHLRLVDEANAEIARFAFVGTDFQAERALMVAEIYRKDGVWRVSATGQGFNGGLEALVRHFGGEVAASAEPAPPPPSKPVSLSKITLEKRGNAVSLEKKSGGAHGEVLINLNWRRPPAKKGLFGRLSAEGGVDLDLGCLVEMRNGAKGCIQALGNAFGALNQPPFVQLDADDRTGASAEGENLRVNGQHWDELQRLLVYAFIYEGAPNWSSTNAVVTVRTPGQPEIEVLLDSHDDRRTCCAIVLLENQGGAIKVSKEVTYFPSQMEMDQAYRWGLRWSAGSK
jgi:tellurite resistance protein TerA